MSSYTVPATARGVLLPPAGPGGRQAPLPQAPLMLWVTLWSPHSALAPSQEPPGPRGQAAGVLARKVAPTRDSRSLHSVCGQEGSPGRGPHPRLREGRAPPRGPLSAAKDPGSRAQSEARPRRPAAPTFRAEAAVHAVLLAQAADLQVGAGVHAGRAALQVNHVPGAALGWNAQAAPERRGRLHPRGLGLPPAAGRPRAQAGAPPLAGSRPPSPPTCRRHSRHSVGVLQLPGRPPAWEHWRENSATVLHTQDAPGGHWQRSSMQACT